VSFLREQRWRIAAVVVALAVVVAGKQFYRDASAGELRWILAPTAQLVSWVTRHDFVYEAGQGWMNTDVMFVIAPACAGLNFALAAYLALVLGGVAGMTTWRETAKRLGFAALLAFAATLVVNTIRIAIAVDMHRADLHRIEGIVVYLAGLCGLYALARALDGKRLRAFHWFAVPLGVYLLITLVMPMANGAARRDDFVRHATTVLAICFVAIVVATFAELVRWSLRRKS
jgi:exosortase K